MLGKHETCVALRNSMERSGGLEPVPPEEIVSALRSDCSDAYSG